jgi:HAD superfamily hydrolase (TIGR01490 family)
MRLALFDLDHTLLDGDSNQLWLTWLVEQGAAPPERLAEQSAYYAQYQRGTLDIDAYLGFHLALLVGRALDQWVPIREAFVAARIAPRIGVAARAAVGRHPTQGDLVAVVTATHDFLARGIVDLIAPVPLVATRCSVRDGRFTGRVDGIPCFGPAKPRCVADWLAERGQRLDAFESVHFYSDSANDLPLLESVSHPVVVDADPRLEAIARERGWPMQRWSGASAA